MDEDMKRLAAHVEGLRHVVYGNGEVGISDSVRTLQRGVTGLTTNVESIKTKVDNLERARAKDEHIREGGRRMLFALGAILTFLSGGGLVVGIRVLQALSDVAHVLP